MENVILLSTIIGFSLVIGALVGLYFKLKQQTVAGFLAFGSGVLICALTFGLMEQAFLHGGFDAVIIGFLLGGLIFVGMDYLLHLYGARKHKRRTLLPADKKSNGALIIVGSVLDGIPESLALGIALFNNSSGVGILMAAAIFLSNFSEGISSVNGLLKEKFSKKTIILMWIFVGLFCALVTVLGYYFLNDLDPNNIGVLEAFAAGAILAMLADSMMPEAYEEGGFSIAILTVLGFLTAFIISRY